MKHLERVDEFPCFPFIMVRGKKLTSPSTPSTPSIGENQLLRGLSCGVDFYQELPTQIAGVHYFEGDCACSAIGVIVDKKRDVDAPKSRKWRMQAWDVAKSLLAYDTDNAPFMQDLDDPTPVMSRHASKDMPPPSSSLPPPPSGKSGLT
ncbi:hypothetical protein HAX54_051581 [Datura stramonium]|uniref:Uncharacterized protein n=1 Tax=Datura stramonium TaxID=4076 RepID=A0ABS8WPV0_DATST|nr:hypothetical protein [Datura stramonium]